LKQRVSIFFLFAIVLCSTYSQETSVPVIKEETFSREVTVAFNTNTHSGLIGGVSFRYSQEYSENQAFFLGLEIVNIAHEKERRAQSNATGNTYLPGKINYLFAIRTFFGNEKKLFGKYPEDGIRLSWMYAGGISIGVIKPYFIEYDYSDIAGYPDYRIEAYDPNIHNEPRRILGSGGFFHGFNSSSVTMGIHARTSLNFEFGKGELMETVSGLEVGFNIEYYPQEVTIFDIETEQNVYTSLYLNIYIGQRY
jgi:hypothetical protein